MKTKERLASAALFALFAFAFFICRSFPAIPKMLPSVVTVAGMLLCVALFIKSFFKGKEKIVTEPENAAVQQAAEASGAADAEAASAPSCEDKDEEQSSNAAVKTRKLGQTATVLISAAALIAYVILIKIAGFYTTSFVYIMAMSYLINDKGRYKWWMYPAVAAGILIVIYCIFSLFLKVPLPKGFLI